MKDWRNIKLVRDERGQSLVEVALAIPILIILLVGIVELSSTLNTQNKVTTASRIAAGFGAANYNADEFATETAIDMGQVAINTVTETLEMGPDRWDVYAIKAQTNSDGTDFAVFTYTLGYGNNQIISEAEWLNRVADVRTQMLEDLRSVCSGGGACDAAADLEVVASVPFYRPDPFLGLPVMDWLTRDRQDALTVMRVDVPPDVAGCPVLPIAVRVDQWSLYPSNWYDPDHDPEVADPLKTSVAAFGPHDVQPFPPRDTKVWEYPDCLTQTGKCKDDPVIPSYENQRDPFEMMAVPMSPTLSTAQTAYPRNVPGSPLAPMLGRSFPRGYIYWAREESSGGGSFGWLTWNGDPDKDKLVDSMAPPAGDFMEYYPGSRSDTGELVNINGYDPPDNNRSGNGDGWLQVGEWVEGTPGNKDSAGSQGVQHWIWDKTLSGVDKSRPVTIIVFDEYNDDSGSNFNYRVAGFVLAKILGYSFGGNTGNSGTLFGGKWIVFELLGPATQCYDPPGN